MYKSKYMARNGFTTLNLPTALVEELKVWKMAFSASYVRPFSYGEMIRSFLDHTPGNEPDVEIELDKITAKHPELLEKLGVWGGKEMGERA